MRNVAGSFGWPYVRFRNNKPTQEYILENPKRFDIKERLGLADMTTMNLLRIHKYIKNPARSRRQMID